MAKNEAGRRVKGLTDREIQNLKPNAGKRVELSDFDAGGMKGLFIRANANGTKSWSLLYRRKDGGKLSRWTIGDYPTIGAAEAREKAEAGRVAAKQGNDPADQKRTDREAMTFGDVVAEYLTRAKLPPPIGKKSWREDERILSKLFLPEWKNRGAKTIKRSEVRKIIEDAAVAAPVAANRALAAVSAVFTFAMKRDWLEANPASLIDRQPEKSRDRVLSDDEIRELLAAIADIRTPKRVDETEGAAGPALPPMIARGLEMILRTAQRPGEVFGMLWAEVDTDAAIWTIPASRTKSGVEQRVPLTSKVLELLNEARAAAGPAKNVCVFAGGVRDEPVKPRAVRKTSLKARSVRNASVEDRGKKSMSALRRTKAINFDAHRHDLRRTAATLMEAAGVQPFMIAKVLNHSARDVGRVTAVYTRHPYDAEKRVALETLERRIEAIVAAKDASKVLPFAR